MQRQNYKRVLISGLLWLTAITVCLATVEDHAASWAKNLKEAYHSEKEFLRSTLAAGQCWHMKYTMQTEVLSPKTNSYEVVSTTGELTADKNFRYMKTGGLEVYIDKSDVFTISNKEHTVIHTHTAAGQLDMDDLYSGLAQDSMLRHYKIVSCKTVHEKTVNKDLLQYDLVPIKKEKALYSGFSVFIDPATNIFTKAFVTVNPGYSKEVKSYTLYVNERGAVKPPANAGHVKNMILNNGKLRAPYSTYTYSHLVKK